MLLLKKNTEKSSDKKEKQDSLLYTYYKMVRDELRIFWNLLKKSRRMMLGFFIILLLPVYRNLHLLFENQLQSIPMGYYVNAFFFMWSLMQDMATVIAVFGAYLIFSAYGHRSAYLLGFPFFYFLFKCVQKLPFRDEYVELREEIMIYGILSGILGVIIFSIVERVKFNVNHRIRHSTQQIKGLTDLEPGALPEEMRIRLIFYNTEIIDYYIEDLTGKSEIDPPPIDD